MTESLDNRNSTQENLPPFSFSKKPIYASLQSNKSIISDIIPTNGEHKGESYQEGDMDKSKQEGVVFNDFTYDDQIRAPRMSNIGHYTYKDNSARLSKGSISSSRLKNSLGSDMDKKNSQDDKQEEIYYPAMFDLNQSTRRFSAPSENERSKPYDLSNYPFNSLLYGNKGQKELHEESGEAISDSQKQNILQALKNLNSNSTSEENENSSRSGRFRIKHRPQVGLTTPFKEMPGNTLQQVYRLKKPMCTPAVLRPHNDGAIVSEPSSSVQSTSSSPQKFNYTVSNRADLSTRSSNSSAEFDFPQSLEPTHRHWKPNNYTAHCMKCFAALGNFFTPQRKRRHHCRFCGSIFCPDCLFSNTEDEMQSSEPGIAQFNLSKIVLLDSNARFVIPIIANLENQAALFGQFKNCKVCKDCGATYQSMLSDINSNFGKFLKERSIRDDTLPYVFIENPATSADGLKNQVVNLASDQGISDASRKQSVSNVPTDWTWSSF